MGQGPASSTPALALRLSAEAASCMSHEHVRPWALRRVGGELRTRVVGQQPGIKCM